MTEFQNIVCADWRTLMDIIQHSTEKTISIFNFFQDLVLHPWGVLCLSLHNILEMYLCKTTDLTMKDIPFKPIMEILFQLK